MCSLSDLVGLNPADLVTKLKMLFGVMIGLFGLMNVGAALGFVLDARERRFVLAKLQTAELGFRITPEGAWLWRFSVEPLQSERDAPTGTAVALAELLGVPYSRLRAALPDEHRAGGSRSCWPKRTRRRRAWQMMCPLWLMIRPRT